MNYARRNLGPVLTAVLLSLNACTTTRPAELPPLPAALAPGDYQRQVTVWGATRSYLLHIPPRISPKQATPVVLAFHGAATSAEFMRDMTGLNQKADEAGFVVAYPNGNGIIFLTFDAGGWPESDRRANDVAFTAALLDDLATVVRVDPKRIFATGYSNGGMLCYRLAAELSDRIAAIAPVAGTMAIPDAHPTRPVSVMHFHGTADHFVPFKGPDSGTPRFVVFKSVEASVALWAKLDGCPEKPEMTTIPSQDGMKITKQTYGPGKEGTEVVLFIIEGAGHTWPGQKPGLGFLGASTLSIAANDLMWEFFQRHPRR